MDITQIFDALLRLLEVFVSWPFITFIIILMFRQQIYKLLPKLGENLKKAKTPLGEFEFEPKNVTTALGKTGMSRVAVKSSNASLVVIDGIQETYVSDSFLISWPKAKWNENIDKGKTILQQLSTSNRKLPIYIEKDEIVDNFIPNVNVLVEFIGNLTIREYVDSSIKQMQQMGWQIDSSSFDEDSNVGFISFINSKLNLYQFQRIAIASGRVYVVTASMAKDTLEKMDGISELLAIVNSFRFIV